MSILIKGMEMPTNCGDCYFEQIGAEEDVYGDTSSISYCLLTEWRIALSNRDDMKLPSCPLVEIDDTEWEWCHDCKEYDQESHCCHRWTKVIRQTVEEVKESYKIVTCGECKYWHEGEWYNTCDKHIGHGFIAEHFCSDGERREDDSNT